MDRKGNTANENMEETVNIEDKNDGKTANENMEETVNIEDKNDGDKGKSSDEDDGDEDVVSDSEKFEKKAALPYYQFPKPELEDYVKNTAIIMKESSPNDTSFQAPKNKTSNISKVIILDDEPDPGPSTSSFQQFKNKSRVHADQSSSPNSRDPKSYKGKNMNENPKFPGSNILLLKKNLQLAIQAKKSTKFAEGSRISIDIGRPDNGLQSETMARSSSTFKREGPTYQEHQKFDEYQSPESPSATSETSEEDELQGQESESKHQSHKSEDESGYVKTSPYNPKSPTNIPKRNRYLDSDDSDEEVVPRKRKRPTQAILDEDAGALSDEGPPVIDLTQSDEESQGMLRQSDEESQDINIDQMEAASNWTETTTKKFCLIVMKILTSSNLMEQSWLFLVHDIYSKELNINVINANNNGECSRDLTDVCRKILNSQFPYNRDAFIEEISNIVSHCQRSAANNDNPKIRRIVDSIPHFKALVKYVLNATQMLMLKDPTLKEVKEFCNQSFDITCHRCPGCLNKPYGYNYSLKEIIAIRTKTVLAVEVINTLILQAYPELSAVEEYNSSATENVTESSYVDYKDESNSSASENVDESAEDVPITEERSESPSDEGPPAGISPLQKSQLFESQDLNNICSGRFTKDEVNQLEEQEMEDETNRSPKAYNFIEEEAEHSGDDESIGEPDNDLINDDDDELIDDSQIKETAAPIRSLYDKQVKDDHNQAIQSLSSQFLATEDIQGVKRARKFAWPKDDESTNTTIPDTEENDDHSDHEDDKDELINRAKWSNSEILKEDGSDSYTASQATMPVEIRGKHGVEKKKKNKSRKRKRGSLIGLASTSGTNLLKKTKITEKETGSRAMRSFVFKEKEKD